MKTNKILLLLLSSVLLIPSCKEKNDSVSSTEEENEFVGDVIINEFDDMDDLYRVKQLLPSLSYKVDCTLEIDTSNKCSGDGALHVVYNNTMYGQVYQRAALSCIANADMADIASFSGYFYNDNDAEMYVDLNVVGRETEILSTHTEKLPSKQWTLVTYNLNKVAMDAIYQDVKGFSFTFSKLTEADYPLSFYADKLFVTFGAKTTEEDDRYLAIIDGIVKDIDSLPSKIAMTDTASINKCKDIANRYSELPGIYRPAVTNYQTFKLAMQTYIDSVADKTATDSDVTAFFFDSCFGLAQTSFTYTQTEIPLGISNEHIYDNQEGSLKVTFAKESQWLKFNAISTVNMQDYDYIEFAVYNDTVADIALCLSWDDTHVAAKGQWTLFKVSTKTSNFKPSYLIEWDFTHFDSSYFGDWAGHAPEGDIYISKVTLHRASATTFIQMLDALPSSLTYSDESKVEEVRNYYESLHKDEKAKISQSDYNRLLVAEKQILASYFEFIGDIIDALPAVDNLQAYNGAFVIKAYKILSAMTESEKEQYLTTSQINKITSLYDAYMVKYDELYPSIKQIGTNIGVSWNVTFDITNRVDNEYGNVADYKISKDPHTDLSGAVEIPLPSIDVTDYSKIVFWIKPAHSDTFYLSRSAWRGGDKEMGYMLSAPLVANTWNKIEIDASKYAGALFMEFFFADALQVSIGDTYSFTSFYGVKA